MDNQKQKIDFYPEVLCRIGNLPFDVLENISWSKKDFDSIDLPNYFRLKEESVSFTGNRKEELKHQKKIKDFEAAFEQMYLKQQQVQRSFFTAIAGNSSLQKGLLQSSPSLWEGLQRYRLQVPSVYRKKERQTERSMAQYLARICTKTSPFSTFTALSLQELSGKTAASKNSKNGSIVRINNYVLAQLEELLGLYPPVYQELAVRLNPTLRMEEGEYVYLMNSRNVESIQRMEQNEVLVLIFEIIEQYDSGLLTFKDLGAVLTKKVEAPRDQLDSYLTDLIQYGILNWVWPVSGTDSNWNKSLLEWFSTIGEFEGKEALTNALALLQDSADRLPKLPADERWPLIKDNFHKLKNCFQEISALIPNVESSDNEAFRLFYEKELILKPEKLFYEDSRIEADVNWSEDHLKASVSELDELMTLVSPLCIHPETEAPLHFFKWNYNREDRMSLMAFYEAFYQYKLNEENVEPNTAKEQLQDLKEFQNKKAQILSKHIKINPNFNVHLPLSVLKTVFVSTKMKVNAISSPKSFGALLQLQSTLDGQYKSYVDAVFTGYGKMLGRFFHLFPKKHTILLQQWVEGLRNDALWLDNTDASFHNANAHPPILSKIVSIPGGQQQSYNVHQYPPNQLQEKHNIALTDLSVGLNKSGSKLLLLHKGEEVTVFNFGLEALQTRSPMYRLLSTFSMRQPDLNPFKAILLQVTRQESASCTRFPRVYVGDHLILQRKTWFIPKANLPLREESEAAYFLKVNVWRERVQLPESVFITISPMELSSKTEREDRKSAAYKPQYIDFKSPALVSHFGRSIRNVTAMLKVEEVLPGRDEMLKVNGRNHAVELMVQWATGDLSKKDKD